jgi:hypothetical protein
VSKRGRRTNHPPDGVAWIWHTIELVSSPAWRTRSINCRRLIDFLEIEHLQHGGVENGSLLAPYSQLVSFGIGRRFIHGAIKVAEQRGLIQVDRGGRKGVVLTEVSRFRLTYHWTRTKAQGLWNWHEPTDNWKNYSDPEPAIGAPSCTDTVHLRALATVHLRVLPPAQALENTTGDRVHLCTPPSISWARGHLVSEHAEMSGEVCAIGTPSRANK